MKIFKLMKLYIMLINILVIVEDGKNIKINKGEKNVLWIYFNKLYVSYR